MAIARYFSKNLLAINQLLSSDHDALADKLSAQVIGIAFGANATSSFEGRAALDLMTRLLSRLYPSICFQNIGGDEAIRKELIALAKQINGGIEIIDDAPGPDCYVIAGDIPALSLPTVSSAGTTIFFGANGWNAIVSLNHPAPFSSSRNPFGCGVASCMAASLLFRHIFRESLGDLPVHYDATYSTYLNQIDGQENPEVNDVEMTDVVIAGLGAIGNGCIWALAKVPNLQGTLHLVDKEVVAETNVQRYVMTEEHHVDKPKVEIATACLANQGRLQVIPYQNTWGEYIGERKDTLINCVAVGIDNKKDRIGIQSSLPKTIFNAFTEPETIGISRHLDFINSACLACGYIPVAREKDYINEVAENLNIPELSEFIKGYLNSNKPVDATILAAISQANNVPPETLQHFIGISIPQFYSEFVCGGILLSMTNNTPGVREIDAPLAFQSALAGILLAAELVKFHSGSNITSGSRTDFFPLQPLGRANPVNRNLPVDSTGRCLCRDLDFRAVYQNKWPQEEIS